MTKTINNIIGCILYPLTAFMVWYSSFYQVEWVYNSTILILIYLICSTFIFSIILLITMSNKGLRNTLMAALLATPNIKWIFKIVLFYHIMLGSMLFANGWWGFFWVYSVLILTQDLMFFIIFHDISKDNSQG